ALAAIGLRFAEELRQLAIALALRVLNVGLQPQRVVQAFFGEPDQVVILVRCPSDLAGLVSSHAFLHVHGPGQDRYLPGCCRATSAQLLRSLARPSSRAPVVPRGSSPGRRYKPGGRGGRRTFACAGGRTRLRAPAWAQSSRRRGCPSPILSLPSTARRSPK